MALPGCPWSPPPQTPETDVTNVTQCVHCLVIHYDSVYKVTFLLCDTVSPSVCFSKIKAWSIDMYTSSLGARWAPTSSLRPFGPAWLRPSRPSGAQAVWPSQHSIWSLTRYPSVNTIQWLTHYPIIAPLRGSHGLSARRARRTMSSRPEGPKTGPMYTIISTTVFTQGRL